MAEEYRVRLFPACYNEGKEQHNAPSITVVIHVVAYLEFLPETHQDKTTFSTQCSIMEQISFQYRRPAFLSAVTYDRRGQRQLIHAIIRNLESGSNPIKNNLKGKVRTALLDFVRRNCTLHEEKPCLGVLILKKQQLELQNEFHTARKTLDDWLNNAVDDVITCRQKIAQTNGPIIWKYIRVRSEIWKEQEEQRMVSPMWLDWLTRFTCCCVNPLDYLVRTRKVLTVNSDINQIQRENEEQGCCSICLDELKKGTKVIGTPSCSHKFHGSCILLWLVKNPTCPLCRSELMFQDYT